MLYVTVHNYKIESEETPLDLAREGQTFLFQVRSIPGFRAYYMFAGGEHAIASVSLFETKDGIAECDRLAADFIRERFAGHRLSDVAITEGEVFASEVERPNS